MDESSRQAYRDELPTVLRMAELGDPMPLRRYNEAMSEMAAQSGAQMKRLCDMAFEDAVREGERSRLEAQTKLRREFATAAMQAYIQAGKIGAEEVAKLSYEHADAMMAAESATYLAPHPK